MILVQTPTGTKMMNIADLLDDNINLNGIRADGFIDPMTMKTPTGGTDYIDEFELPDLNEIEELDKEDVKKATTRE